MVTIRIPAGDYQRCDAGFNWTGRVGETEADGDRKPGSTPPARRYGEICSTTRREVAAVENRETAAKEAAGKLALWRVAPAFGFVFELQDVMEG